MAYRRAKQPLDPKARKAANDAIAPKTGGRRLTNSAKDGPLREEWMDAYIAAGGEVIERKPKPSKPKSPATSCPKDEIGDLVVEVVRDDTGKPVEGAKVEATGPATRKGTTGQDGAVSFSGMCAGTYDIAVEVPGFSTTPATANVSPGSTASVTVPVTVSITVEIEMSPKKVIHRYNTPVTFKAKITPSPAPAGLVYTWTVDGVVEAGSKGDTLSKRFTPAATHAERRKDYKVRVAVGGASDEIEKVRVAQNVDVGTANVTKSNAGMDTYGWTDSSPESFDTGLNAAEETRLKTKFSLTRDVLKKTLPDGSTQYGRLQYGAATGDMTTSGWTKKPAALVITRSSAFRWDKEEFDSMLDHELEHCSHRQESSTSATNIWAKLWDKGFPSHFSPFTEMLGYFEYVQSTEVSYKFLLDYGAFASFKREYNGAKTGLGTLSGSTKTAAKALVKSCYDDIQFKEITEPTSEGWDHHIDAP